MNSETLLLSALYQHFSVWSREIYRRATFQQAKSKKTSEIRRFQRFLVRVGRLELPASCSQSKRATNCATPGYEIFQLWSNMWSTPIFDQLPAVGEVLSAQLSQGFPGFPMVVARTWASRSQSRRATNCATPGYEVVGWPGRILPSWRATDCATPR